MADSDVIKEFLVGLGFKVDQKGLKNFTGTIGGATKAVAGLVTTIAGAALTVSAGVAAFASNLEGIYFASQRIGASATSLKSAEYAARDLGASADQVRGSLEGMARFLRDNPGGEGFLQGIGVATRDANGNLRDTADLMVSLGTKLRSMPWYQAKQYASVLGIDDNTLRAILSGEFGRKLDENRKKLANSGMDQATKDAHAFMEQLRGVGLQFDSFAVQVEAALLKRLGPDMQHFAEWFRENGPMIADRVADLAGDLVDLAEKGGPALKKVLDFFVLLDQKTDGWSTKLVGILVLLRALGAWPLVAGIARLAAGLGMVGAAALLYSGELNPGEDADVQMRHDAEDSMAGQIRGGDDMAARVVKFFEAQGWTKAQAAGIAANLSEESRFDHKAIGDDGNAYGVAQWHPDRQKNFEKWSGKDIRQSTLEDQLRFVHHELTEGSEKRAGDLLRAAKTASEAGEVVSRKYERPAAKDDAARNRAATAEQIVLRMQAPKPEPAQQVRVVEVERNAEDRPVPPAQPKTMPSMQAPKPEQPRPTGPDIQEVARRSIDLRQITANLEGMGRAVMVASAAPDKRLQQLLTAEQNARQMGAQVDRSYAQPAQEAAKAVSKTVQLTQKTDIHVHGSSDPASTAQAVAGAQGRVTQDMTRNFASAVN